MQGLFGMGQCRVAMSLSMCDLCRNSVQYTQLTMEEALKRVTLMQADLRGTEILAPLKSIYNGPSIPGYPLQV